MSNEWGIDDAEVAKIMRTFKRPRRVGVKEVAYVTFGTCVAWVSRVPTLAVLTARLAIALGGAEETLADAERGPRYRSGVRAKLGRALFGFNPTGMRLLMKRAVAGEYNHPDLFARLASHFSATGLSEAAVELRRRALEQKPSATRHVLLAQALLGAEGRGFRHDGIVGVALTHVGQVDEAIKHLRLALAMEPSNPHVQFALGRTLFAEGFSEEGLALMESSIKTWPSASRSLELARALGRPHVLRFDDAASAYEAASRQPSLHKQAVAGLISASTRGALDWGRMWSLATEIDVTVSPGSQGETFRELAGRAMAARAIDDDLVSTLMNALDGAEAEGTLPAHAVLHLTSLRLAFAGFLEECFALKRVLARSAAAPLSPALRSGNLRKQASALVYLGRASEAAQLLESHPTSSRLELEHLRIKKLTADAHYAQGNLAPLVEFAAQCREAAPMPTDARMEELVRGKRVAIVGPANSPDEFGSLIDGYDTVVRPRFTPDFIAQRAREAGRRTDISYYSGRDLQPMLEVAGQAVAENALQLVVARALAYSTSRRLEREWLRFYRHDFSLYFQANSLGVTRMVYDLVQFEPAEIALFHADMYAGVTAFAPGYRPAHDTQLAPGSILNDLVVAHDLKFDFELLQLLQRAGAVTPYGISAEILALSPDDYIERVRLSGNIS